MNESQAWLTVICSSPLLAMAFSRLVRKKIFDRDGGMSVWSGQTNNLHAAHISHDKRHPRYDHESNGRMLTRFEHTVDHINRAGRNGLTVSQNNWAIKKLKEGLSSSEIQELSTYVLLAEVY